VSFPIFKHEMPWESSRDVRARSAHRYLEDGTPKATSFWKRERSLRRRGSGSDEPAVNVDPVVSEDELDADATEPTSERLSVWKRDISFGRRKDTDAGSAGEPEEEAAEPTPEHTSIWKRDISFGRRKDSHADSADDGNAWWPASTWDDPAEADAVDDLDVPQEAAAEQKSFWKRERSFGRRRGSHDESDAAEAEADVDPQIAQRLDLYAPAPSRTSYETHETQETQDRDVAEPPSETIAEAPLWESEQPSEEVPVGEQAAHESPEPEFAPADEELVSFGTPAASYDNAEVEEQVAVEAADTAPIVAEDEEIAARPSFWKRERSFGRRTVRDEEQRVEEAQVEEPPAEPTPKVGPVASISAGEKKAPIWKRELSIGRKRGDWEYGQGEAPEPVDVTATPDVPVEAAASLADDPDVTNRDTESTQRRSRGIGRRARTAKEPKASKASKGSKGAKGGKKLVGLRVGASQIVAAHVHSNGSHEVLKMARTPLERGIVVSGELRNPDALVVALKAFFNESKLPKRNIRLGIASNRVGVRVLDVPGVEDPALLGNAVRFRAQEVLPIPLSEAVLDYRVLRERTDDDGNVTYEVLVAFAYRELVDRYASVCRSAGLRLVGIDLDGFALLRALVDPRADETRLGGAAVVTLSIGHDRSIMSVSDGTVCEFTRVIEWGGSALDTAVARILALTPSQAEPIKRALTLDRLQSAPEGLSDEQAGRARSAMVQEVHALARECVSSLQFYQAQPRSLDIGEIVITGGMAHMPGLAQQLQELIGVTVRIGDPLARVKVGKHVNSEESIGSFALAIGLGIED
jgi:type IV pilus assembly protein PilM